MKKRILIKLLILATCMCIFYTPCTTFADFVENGGDAYDFNKYEGGLVDGNFTGVADFLQPVTIDEDHGISMALIERDGKAAPWTEYNFSRDVLADNICEFQFETDFYITEGIKKNCNIILDGASKLTIAQISTAYKFNVYKSGASGTAYAISANEWYNLRIVSDISNSKLTFVLKDSKGQTIIHQETPIPETHTKATGIRFAGPFVDSGNTSDIYWAFDNMKLSYIYKLPDITGITSDGTDDNTKIDFKAENINISFGYPIYHESLLAEHIFIKNKYGTVKVASVSALENTITVTPSASLESATDYEVIFDEALQLIKDVNIEKPISVPFTTTDDSVELLSSEFVKKTDSVELTMNMANNTDQPKTVCVIANFMDGNRIVKAFAFDVEVSDEGNTVSFPLLSDAEIIKVFIIDNYTSSLLITKEPIVYIFD